jgi:tetratricopeptide (TPR) repeat protein
MSNDSTQPTDEPLESQVDSATSQDETPKEPWTAEKVVEWNNYYNIYVVIGLMFLAVVTSLNYLEDSSIWASLRSGEITLSQGFPLTRDTLSFTSEGRRWVNLGWAFDAVSAAVFGIGASFASESNAERYGAAAVTILHSVVRLLTFLVLLTIGHNRRWLWGRSVLLGLVIVMALGSGVVGPDMWGIFFLSVLLRLMFLATDRSRNWAFYCIPVLIAVWVNFDSSATFGLLITIAWSVSLLISGKRLPSPVPSANVIATLVGSILACLINPWTIYAFPALFRLSNQYSMIPGGIFGSVELPGQLRNALAMRMALFLVVGAVTFWLNTTKFRLDRLVMLVVSALSWAIWLRYGGEFTIVVAIIAGINLEEWYVDDFGTEGKLGWKWTAFSIGGRSLTILAFFGLSAQHITGYGLAQGSSTFGLGFSPDRFPFESAEYLKTAKISGEVFNWNAAQGNALLWRAYPARKTFLDDRRNLFSEEIKSDRELIRKALRDDDVSSWKPLLDKYKISAVMVQALSTSLTETAATLTVAKLSQSPNWIPIYDDGLVVIFGRVDASPEDLAFFQGNKLDAERIVFKTEDTLPAFNRPPASTSLLDEVIATKALALTQPHSQAAVRWLFPPGASTDNASPQLTPLANCIAAIREARRAIAEQPDQTQAYRVLTDAYRMIHSQELALMSDIKLDSANLNQIYSLQAGPNPLGFRFRQRVAALNFAIQTSPRPTTESEREVLASLHSEFSQLMLLANAIDIGRNHLRQALELAPDSSNSGDRRSQLANLDQAILQRETEMNSMSLEEQANASIRINRSLSLGLIEPALTDLREAEATGSSPDTIVPLLVDLYCQLGMPDQAIPLMGNMSNKMMETTAGLSSYRQGLVSALLGDYSGAFVGWSNESIPVAKLDEMRRGLMAGQMWLSGELGTATRTFMELPDQGRILANRLFELGLVHIEAGQPQMATDALTEALKRDSESDFVPIAKYYLEKLGKPFVESAKDAKATPPDAAPTVPDPSKSETEAKPVSTENKAPSGTATSPASTKP